MAQLRAAAVPVHACVHACVLLCACWSRGAVLTGTAQEAHRGRVCVLARLCGCGLRALPPAQPPAMARHAAPSAAGVPRVPQRTRIGSEARPSMQAAAITAEVRQGGSSTPRSSAQQHPQVRRGRTGVGAGGEPFEWMRNDISFHKVLIAG
jgi:hypothetical protein